MSGPGKDNWHPPHPSSEQPSQQPQQPQQQQQPAQQQAPSQIPQGSSGIPPHQQPQHRQLGQSPFQPTQQPQPVLPPPREIGGAGAFYNPPPSHPHPHPLPLPGLSAATHPSYSLSGIGPSAPAPHAGPNPSVPGLAPSGPAHQAQRDQPSAQHPPQPNQPPQPQHPAMAGASPPTAQAPPPMMHPPTSPTVTNQGPQLVSMNAGQGPPMAQAVPQQPPPSQQGPPHSLNTLSNASQPPQAQSGQPPMMGGGQPPAAPAQTQMQGPSSGAQGQVNGPGGPILNVGNRVSFSHFSHSSDTANSTRARIPSSSSGSSGYNNMLGASAGYRQMGQARGYPDSPPLQDPYQNPSGALPGYYGGDPRGVAMFVKIEGSAESGQPLNELPPGFQDVLSQNMGQVGVRRYPQTPISPSGRPQFAYYAQDALSYLDQVKFQFQDQPDVYNKFLDIMKDFKSQTIDTPGVIDRVSTLFSGHPQLIQGFNTFLPPGYRIECSEDPRDTKITVTTPSGVHHASSGAAVSITGQTGMPGPQVMGGPGQPSGTRFFEQTGSRWGGEGIYGPYSQQQQVHQAQAQNEAFDMARQQQAAHAHAQAQAQAQAQAHHAHPHSHPQHQPVQGVNQLQSAAAHTNGAGVVRGPGGPMGPGGPSTPVGGERGKGPVEFNHAISYVNKIKNRFSHQPEIYKNFLEILQTYQRESKPIQDVYSQVTQLFREAPDLLEDFKQFLPESAAQARAAAAAKAAAEDAANGAAMQGNGPQAGPGARLPAVGTFPPPPSITKEKGAKKRQPAQIQPEVKADAAIPRGANKRAKTVHQKPTLEQQIASVEPTLTPFQPEPLGAPPTPMASTEELAFFDRVKKFIGNKQTYNEFLKLLNLFSQGLIDKAILVEKVHNFVGGNRELMDWFKRFVKWDSKEERVDNNPKLMNKVRLNVCRALGPSYRLLPKQEMQRPCSGRDEMCWEVLNDQWASHPTWASEDSGFVAHKKNQYEETLHRLEEERHDYDFNIEANLRTIQLLEPIAQRIANMSQEEKNNFRLQPGLGGQSKTIYQRIIKKVYEKEKGLEVIEHLHNQPAVAVPIVLKRLKQKDEEWKAAQREWQKVWRDQTQRAFWRSLDHQGITVKTTDKKAHTAKALLADIQAKYREQHDGRLSSTTPIPEYQLRYNMDDFGVIMDASRLLGLALEHNNAFSHNDRDKIEGFLKSFIPLFFGLDQKEVEDSVNSTKSQEDDGEDSVMGDAPSPQPVRRPHKHDHDLLRDVLTRHKRNRKDKDGSVTSRDSSVDLHEDEPISPQSEKQDDDKTASWITAPKPGTTNGSAPEGTADAPRSAPQSIKRTKFAMYANNTIYTFFRLFQILCDRLRSIKNCEEDIRRDVQIRKNNQVAKKLNILVGPQVEDIFPDTSPTANYYRQVLDMCEKLIEGEIESPQFEDQLRSIYIQQGWKVYTVDRLCNSILKQIQQIVPNEAKEKNGDKEKAADIVLRFSRDRQRKEITPEKGEYMEIVNYRRYVENIIPHDDPVFKIDWMEDSKELGIRIQPRDEQTFPPPPSADEKWKYYIQTYQLIPPTEGVPIDRCGKVFLRRSYPAEEEVKRGEWEARENMQVRICVNTYRMFFMAGTDDVIVRKTKPVDPKVREARTKRWREGVLPKLGWRKDASEEEQAKVQREWDEWTGKRSEEDVEMKEDKPSEPAPAEPAPITAPAPPSAAVPEPERKEDEKTEEKKEEGKEEERKEEGKEKEGQDDVEMKEA